MNHPFGDEWSSFAQPGRGGGFLNPYGNEGFFAPPPSPGEGAYSPVRQSSANAPAPRGPGWASAPVSRATANAIRALVATLNFIALDPTAGLPEGIRDVHQQNLFDDKSFVVTDAVFKPLAYGLRVASIADVTGYMEHRLDQVDADANWGDSSGGPTLRSLRASARFAVGLGAIGAAEEIVAWRIAAAEARAAAGVEALAARGGGTTLFHGSDVASVESIVSNGLDREAARALGGGDVFWTTPKPEVARIFAQANPAGGAPAVAGIRLPAGALERMQAARIVQVEQSTGAVKVLNWKAFNESAEFFVPVRRAASV